MFSNVLQMPKPKNKLNYLRHQMLALDFHNGFSGKDYEQRLKDCGTDRDKISEWYKSFALEIVTEHIDEIIRG